MLFKERFHLGFSAESWSAAFLPAVWERDQVTEGLAHSQHLNHP